MQNYFQNKEGNHPIIFRISFRNSCIFDSVISDQFFWIFLGPCLNLIILETAQVKT